MIFKAVHSESPRERCSLSTSAKALYTSVEPYLVRPDAYFGLNKPQLAELELREELVRYHWEVNGEEGSSVMLLLRTAGVSLPFLQASSSTKS